MYKAMYNLITFRTSAEHLIDLTLVGTLFTGHLQRFLFPEWSLLTSFRPWPKFHFFWKYFAPSWMLTPTPEPHMPHLQLYFSSTIFWVYTFYLFVELLLFHRNVNHIPSTVQDYSIVGGIQNKRTMWYIISGWLSTQTPMLTHYVFWKHLLCTSYV